MSGHFPLWSQTAATNSTVDSTINWAEGQAPSSVNDSSRAMMAALASWRDDVSGLLTTAGIATAYTVTTNEGLSTTPLDGQYIRVSFHLTNGAAPTLAADGGTAFAIQTAPGVAIAATSLAAGANYGLRFSTATPAWILSDFYNVALGPNSVATVNIQDDAVTYAKIQNVANGKLLGNFTGGAAAVSEYTIAGGLSVTGTVLTGSMAVQGMFKNMSIKVATNTTVTVAADYVVMLDTVSGNTRTVAISATLNFSNVGVVNGIDATGIASASWYYIWAISNGTTDGVLASLSSSAPTMPGGYTWKARIGAVRTFSAAATLLGTFQFGRSAQYVHVAGLTHDGVPLPIIISGAQGTVGTPSTWVATSVANFIPTTAQKIKLVLQALNGETLLAAPNKSYAAAAPPMYSLSLSNTSNTTLMGEFIVEDGNVYYSSNSGGELDCMGWEDNL